MTVSVCCCCVRVFVFAEICEHMLECIEPRRRIDAVDGFTVAALGCGPKSECEPASCDWLFSLREKSSEF